MTNERPQGRSGPVLFIKKDWIDSEDLTAIGEEAKELVSDLDARRDTLKPLIP
jgi:hypothetical protein